MSLTSSGDMDDLEFWLSADKHLPEPNPANTKEDTMPSKSSKKTVKDGKERSSADAATPAVSEVMDEPMRDEGVEEGKEKRKKIKGEKVRRRRCGE